MRQLECRLRKQKLMKMAQGSTTMWSLTFQGFLTRFFKEVTKFPSSILLLSVKRCGVFASYTQVYPETAVRISTPMTKKPQITSHQRSVMSDCYISSVTSVNLKKADMASRNIVIKNNTRCFQSALQQSLDVSFLVLCLISPAAMFSQCSRVSHHNCMGMTKRAPLLQKKITTLFSNPFLQIKCIQQSAMCWMLLTL